MPFDIGNWRSIAAIEERAATQDDVSRCIAVFAAGPGQAEPISSPGLPALAVLTKEDGTTEQVVIIQMEKQVGGPLELVGYLLPDGGNGIATLPEVTIIEHLQD